MDLDGKRILRSGAPGGPDQAIAAGLAGAGAKLVLSSRREKELKEIAKGLPGGARAHKVIAADLSKKGAGAKLVADAGDIDGLVANAAMPATGRMEELTGEQVARALEVNFDAPILMTHALVPSLIEKGDGHILYIASLAGRAARSRC